MKIKAKVISDDKFLTLRELDEAFMKGTLFYLETMKWKEKDDGLEIIILLRDYPNAGIYDSFQAEK